MKKRVHLFLLIVLVIFMQACLWGDGDSGDLADDSLIKKTNNPTVEVQAPKLIDDSAINLVEKSSGYCKALVPSDWSFTSVSPYVGADAWSLDNGSHAAWGIAAIYYALYPDPLSALTYLVTAVGYQGITFVAEPVEIGSGFQSVEFTSDVGRRGQILYKVYEMDPTFFIISVYLGATLDEEWEQNGAQALTAAISIRCVSQLRPSTSGVDLDSSDPSSSQDNPEVDLSEEWSEAILGYENVYSPTTGEHFMAPLDSYWATGPDGGGYYRELPGGGYELLEDGFGDY